MTSAKPTCVHISNLAATASNTNVCHSPGFANENSTAVLLSGLNVVFTRAKVTKVVFC